MIHLLSIILVCQAGKKQTSDFKNHHYDEKASCHLKRINLQHLIMGLISMKSSHTGWINDTLKDGKWVSATRLPISICASWLSSAASTMHHNLHQLFGSSWLAPSGCCNLIWAGAIKHHRSVGLKFIYFSCSSYCSWFSLLVSSQMDLVCGPGYLNCSSAVLHLQQSRTSCSPHHPWVALPISARVGRANGSAPH